MKDFKKIAGINLIVLVAYSILIRFLLPSSDRELGILILSMFAIGIHTLVNAVTAVVFFIKGQKDTGTAFLLSAVLVLLIGFPSCFGNASW